MDPTALLSHHELQVVKVKSYQKDNVYSLHFVCYNNQCNNNSVLTFSYVYI